VTETLAEALTRVADDLRVNRVQVPEHWREELRAGLGGRDLDSLGPDNADALVAAYVDSKDARLDDVTAILFGQAMSDLIAANPATIGPALVSRRLDLFMTEIVVQSRLASKYFHEGRRHVGEPSGRWLLTRSLRLNASVLTRNDRARPEQKKMGHSQAATAAALMARVDEDGGRRSEVLTEGLHHSLEAEKWGDTSREHDGFAVELALRLSEFGGRDTFLPVAGAISRLSKTENATSRGLVGDVHFARAAIALAELAPDQAVPQLFSAVDQYNKAIALPHGPQDADLGYHYAKRGRSYSLLYRLAVDDAGRRDTLQLTRALADWSEPSAIPHRRDHEVAQLLLDRARLSAARGDTAARAADIAEASRLIAGGMEGRSGDAVRAGAIGASIEDALDRADPDRLVELLRSATSLSADAPAPSGEMAKAAIWLRSRADDRDWRRLAEEVLDRIEIDVAHPALTPAARGNVAGHAAGLARFLALDGSDDTSSILRALELSRAHIAIADPLSAPALDGAAQSAHAYAKSRGSHSDAPDEDVLGNWQDVALWSIGALQTQQKVRTTVDARFDLLGCVLRLSEAAIVLFTASGDTAWVRSAEEGLHVARDIEPDPAMDQIAAQLAAVLLTAPLLSTGAAPGKSRRVSAPAGAPASIASTPAPATAWLKLAEADASTGAAAESLRAKAAVLLANLASESDGKLGGKARGGRRGVTGITDPYGITRQLVVLKRVDAAAAQREFEALRYIRQWAREAGATAWTAPEPLGIVPDGDDATLVMRRLPGYTLAHHALDHLEGPGADPRSMFAVAVDALADFHTAMPKSGRPENVMHAYQSAASFIAGVDAGAQSTDDVAPILLAGSPLAKKDAHSGNWIWSGAAGALVLLDVESTATRPAMVELSTLLDDLPLYPLNGPGWTTRTDLARRYNERLPRETRMPDGDLRTALQAGALNVAVIGIARLLRRGRGTSSRGARLSDLQERHYQALLQHLSTEAADRRVREAATRLAVEKRAPS